MCSWSCILTAPLLFTIKPEIVSLRSPRLKDFIDNREGGKSRKVILFWFRLWGREIKNRKFFSFCDSNCREGK
jgi:hypothetical protein